MIFSISVTPKELIYMKLQRWLSFKHKNAWSKLTKI